MSSKEPFYFSDQIYDKTALPHKQNTRSTFENCIFRNFDFSTQNLASFDFIDTSFENCNLSLVRMDDTGMKNVDFKNCKLTGVDFSKCKDFLFHVNFYNSILDYASYFKKKNKQGQFIDCSLKDVDLTDADLSGSLFQNCDLMNAIFSSTILNGADLTAAYNFSINPAINSLKKTRFSYQNIPGLLNSYDIIIE